MSQVRIRPRTHGNSVNLTEILKQEFQNLSPGRKQPLISIEQPGDRTHLLVIWDEWSDLTQRERSEIILEAYQDAVGSVDADRVSVAMGLTATEAERLGYEFVPA